MNSRLNKLESILGNAPDDPANLGSFCDAPLEMFNHQEGYVFEGYGASCNCLAWEAMYRCSYCPLYNEARYRTFWRNLCPD